MSWSIFKDSSKHYNEWESCYTAWFVDYDIKTNHFPNQIKFLHDGPVDVYFDSNFVRLNVINGRWDPDTENKILDMTSKTYHGEYIEGFAKRNGRLEVIMGS